EMKNWALEMHDAGHIPGSAMALIEMNGKRICYSGDFKLQDTELHKGAEPPENVDVLMIESTYANREHPDRKELEKKLKNEIWETLDDGGYVLFPCFAVGRSQEMVQMLNRFKIGEEIYLDGMAKAASDIILDFPSYVRDYDSLLRALKRVHWVRTPGMRKKVLSEPSVIVSTAGMLEGGPAIGYLLSLNAKNKNSKVIFTGYSVENTNGWRVQNKRQMKTDRGLVDIELDIEYFDFSAHAGKSDLWKLVKDCSPEKVVCIHGDHCETFAQELREEGYDAVAPKAGDKISV
ncbi:MAG: MBL fold metallo-hydrolase, partial [Candidatus Micrarchaeota archaeon]